MTFACRDIAALLRDHADRETEAADAHRIEEHLASCGTCAERLQAERELKLAIQSRFRPGPAPAGLPGAISRRIREEMGRPSPRRGGPVRRLLAGAALAAALVLVAAGLLRFLQASGEAPAPREERALASILVEDHLKFLGAPDRAVLATAECEVAEDWFRRQLQVPVRLPRFPAESVSLEGGRVCRLLERRVALLFYTRGGSTLSLFAMDSAGLDLRAMEAGGPGENRYATEIHKGHRIVCWLDDGLLLALVADKREKGLEELLSAAYPQ